MSNLINMNGGFYCDSEYKNINHALDFSGFNLEQLGGGEEYNNKFIVSGLYVKHNQFGGAEDDNEATEMLGEDVIIDVEQEPANHLTKINVKIAPAAQSERENSNSYRKISNDMYDLAKKIKIQKKEKEKNED